MENNQDDTNIKESEDIEADALFFFVEKESLQEEEENNQEPNNLPKNKYKQPFSKHDLIIKQHNQNNETWLKTLKYKNLNNTVQQKPTNIIEKTQKHSYILEEDVKIFFEPLHISITSKQKNITTNFSGILFNKKYAEMKKNLELYSTFLKTNTIDFSGAIIEPNFNMNILFETIPETKKILSFDQSQLNFLHMILQQEDLSYLNYVEEISIGVSEPEYEKICEKKSKIFKELGEKCTLISVEQNASGETYVNYKGNKIIINVFFQKNLKFLSPRGKYVIIEGGEPEVFFNKNVLIEKEDIDHIIDSCKNYSNIVLNIKNLRIPAEQILEIIETFLEHNKKVSLLLSQKSFFDIIKLNPHVLLGLSYIEILTNDDIKLLKKMSHCFDLGDIECNFNISGIFLEYTKPIKINIEKQTDFVLI